MPNVSRESIPRSRSLSQKLALASGAGAALAGLTAEAVPIQSTTLPLSPPATDGDANWDVDGDGTYDFILTNDSSSSAGFEAFALNANNLVVAVAATQFPFDNMAKLASGFAVGGALAPGFNFNPVSHVEVTSDGSASSDMTRGGWALGDTGFFGFKFTNTSGLHYGWAELSLHGTTGGYAVGQGYTILRAYYNDVANASINVGDTGAAGVPEIDPASAGSVLSLVMGSLAMLERRRSRRAAEAPATTVSA